MVKCSLCDGKIENTFLDKLDGTIVKVGSGESSKKFYVCSACQKKYKDRLKEEVEKLE